MRPIQAIELAIRRRINQITGHLPLIEGDDYPLALHEHKGLSVLAENIREAAEQADEADGDKQLKWLEELDMLRRLQS